MNHRRERGFDHDEPQKPAGDLSRVDLFDHKSVQNMDCQDVREFGDAPARYTEIALTAAVIIGAFLPLLFQPPFLGAEDLFSPFC